MAKKTPASSALEPVEVPGANGTRTVAWRGEAARLQVVDESGRAFQVVIVARDQVDLKIVAERVIGDVELDKAGKIICCDPAFFAERVKV